MTNIESGNALIGEDVMDEIGNETGDPVWFIYFGKGKYEKEIICVHCGLVKMFKQGSR